VNLASRYDTDNSNFDNLLKSHLTMKSSLICAVLLTFVSCSAIAADQATPMADIEPMSVMVPKAAITAPNPAEEATVQSGAALDDFSFAAKSANNLPTGDEQNSSEITGSQRQLLYLQEF
jgi:hypothetical protein